MTSEPSRPVPDPQVRMSEINSATFGYLGAIFGGPVIPLIIYLVKARSSPFLRYHAASAVNLSLTCLLYAVSCAIFGGPVIPLIIYLVKARSSPFLRYHAASAVNLSLTCLLYAVSCAIFGGLLALDSVTAALAIALPLAFALWVTMLTYLIRGALAANHGVPRRPPQWICAHILA
jgi:uncharacterized Tic20 family protein